MNRSIPGWVTGALLLLGAAAFYLVRLGHAGLYDLDEAVYAEIGREMAAFHHWLTPRLDSVPYLEKPPLLDWLNAISIRLLGPTVFAARLPTALAAVGAVGVVYGMGRDAWGRRAGVISAILFGTSFGAFVFGRMAMPEMLFLLFAAAAEWGFARTVLDPDAPRFATYGGYAAMGAAVMTKGLIGIIFPALSVAIFVALTRDWALVRRLRLVSGVILFLAVAAPWHVAIALSHPGFLRFYILNEHVARFLGHRKLINYATLPVGTYLIMTLVWLCPWAICLPVAIRRAWPGLRSSDRGDRAFLFVLVWAGSVIGFFVLSAARLEYYALPALPALALCVGRYWALETGEPAVRPRSRGSIATWIALLAFAFALLPAAWLFPRLQHLKFYNLFPSPVPPAAVTPAELAQAKVYDVPGFDRLVPLFDRVTATFLAGTVLAAVAWFRRRPKTAFGVLAAATAASFVLVERGFRLFEPYRSVAPLMAVLTPSLAPSDAIVLEGRYERHAGVGYYTQRHILLYHGDEGILVNGAKYIDPKTTFLSDGRFDALWKGPRDVFFISDDPDCFARLSALDSNTRLVGRAGATWLLANRRRNP